MALSSDNVTVAASGAVYIGPTATAAPTAYETALNAGFKDVGYLSEAGVTITPNETSTKLKAWQSGKTVKNIRRGEDVTVSWEMIESRNEDAKKAYWGSGNVPSAGTVDVVDLTGSEEVAIVIDTVDAGVGVRYYFPKATLSDRGAITIVSTNYQMFPVTFDALYNGTRFLQAWDSVDGS